LKRRDFIIAAGSAITSLSADRLSVNAPFAPLKNGLHELARAKGLFFGSAVNDGEILSPPSAAAILTNCGLVTAQRAQKWPIMWRDQDQETPAEADRLAAFAARNNLLLRGHALIYDAFMPEWVNKLPPQQMRVAFDRRIQFAMTRWRGQVHSWDVVNEALEPNERRSDSLRNTIFLKALGEGYIADAFFRAKDCDASALLCYNDYNLESAASFSYRRRKATLRLLEALKKRGAPIEALGVQAHLKAQLTYNDRVWRDFLKEVAQLGLKIIVSELDVNDRSLPADIAARDIGVADLTSRFLDVTLDEKQVIGVVSWGLTDKQSWMATRHRQKDPAFTREDGGFPRPLPLDSNFHRKPMWHAIASALNSAPNR